MKQLITDIYEIIQDYRREEYEEDQVLLPPMSKYRITRWIRQFEEDDREFLLTELLHILNASYLSKEIAHKFLRQAVHLLQEKSPYKTIEEVLDHCRFLDCQEPHKSQSYFLKMMDEYLKVNFDRSLYEEPEKEIKYWVYLDDVLGTGGTYLDDISAAIDEYGIEEFKASDIVIVGVFCITHQWGRKNAEYKLQLKVDESIYDRLSFYRFYEIQNDPRVNYFNPAPKFNHVYPLECEEGKAFLLTLEEILGEEYDLRHEKYAFREPTRPKKEEFYTSAENRNRYERILLLKGIELYSTTKKVTKPGLRPLGMVNPTYKTFGLGSHFFTFRNISNTCPLAFWYSGAGWYPLFEVSNRG